MNGVIQMISICNLMKDNLTIFCSYRHLSGLIWLMFLHKNSCMYKLF